MSPTNRITIIPPNKERIVSAIEKIYDVIKTLDKDQDVSIVEESSDAETENQKKSPVDFVKRLIAPAQKPVSMSSNQSNEIFTFGQSTNDHLDASTFSSSDNIMHAAPQIDSSTSLDLEYCNQSSSGCPNMASMFSNLNQSNENNYYADQEYEPKYQVSEPEMNLSSLAKFADESNLIQMLPEPSTSNISSGTKRPNDFEDEDIMYKKKITDVVRQDNFASGHNSPTLDSLFEESCKFYFFSHNCYLGKENVDMCSVLMKVLFCSV